PAGSGWRAAAEAAGIGALNAESDFSDMEADWSRMTGLPADGALLVRPDGHIACRFDKAVNDPADFLKRQMAQILASKERVRWISD
ncbi:MAG: hypothetical protein CVT72_14385, partial [Alphaproteobacteria bacterium HGW-Alphaproteobacteria-11]